MNNLAILSNEPPLFLNKEEAESSLIESKGKNVSFYKGAIKYANLPLEEKWKYRKAITELQILINKIQNEEISTLEENSYNLPEVVALLRIRKEMLTYK